MAARQLLRLHLVALSIFAALATRTEGRRKTMTTLSASRETTSQESERIRTRTAEGAEEADQQRVTRLKRDFYLHRQRVTRTSSTGTRASKVKAAVSAVMKRMAAKYNISFGFGYVDATGSVALAGGVDDRMKGTLLSAGTKVPIGSAIKPLTAVLVMQYVEKDALALHDKVAPIVDPILKSLYETTLGDLFGDAAMQITVKMLLGMSSGIDDYDDEVLMQWTLTHTGDLDPIRYLESASRKKHHMFCDPGKCVKYSGANYVLLGFVLLKLQGGKHWEELKQDAMFSKALRAHGHYRHMTFAKHGHCSEYTGVAHQYKKVEGKEELIDMHRKSCLNGWTMGNVMSNGEDMAQFYYDLFTLAPSGKGFISQKTLNTMLEFKAMDNDDWCWGPGDEPGGCSYGLGFQRDHAQLDEWPMKNEKSKSDIKMEGHVGQNWGSGAQPCGYNPKHKFGICITFQSTEGLNKSLDEEANRDGQDEAACLLYDAVLKVVVGPRLDCSTYNHD